MAVVHSYFSQDSLEVGAFKISWQENEMGDWDNFNISSFKQISADHLKSWIQDISDMNLQTLFTILENKKASEKALQDLPQNTTDSIMQTLLKEARDSKESS